MAPRSGKDLNAKDAGGARKSPLPVILAIAVLTLLGAGGGGFVGMSLVASLKSEATGKAKAREDEKPSPYNGDVSVRELAPVVTNLASPANAWIRLQAAIVYDKKALPNPDVTAAQITNDLSAFVKTLSASQIQGASGLQDLREDLNERARVRGEGRVRELIIEMLVVQ